MLSFLILHIFFTHFSTSIALFSLSFFMIPSSLFLFCHYLPSRHFPYILSYPHFLFYLSPSLTVETSPSSLPLIPLCRFPSLSLLLLPWLFPHSQLPSSPYCPDFYLYLAWYTSILILSIPLLFIIPPVISYFSLALFPSPTSQPLLYFLYFLFMTFSSFYPSVSSLSLLSLLLLPFRHFLYFLYFRYFLCCPYFRPDFPFHTSPLIISIPLLLVPSPNFSYLSFPFYTSYTYHPLPSLFILPLHHFASFPSPHFSYLPYFSHCRYILYFQYLPYFPYCPYLSLVCYTSPPILSIHFLLSPLYFSTYLSFSSLPQLLNRSLTFHDSPPLLPYFLFLSSLTLLSATSPISYRIACPTSHTYPTSFIVPLSPHFLSHASPPILSTDFPYYLAHTFPHWPFLHSSYIPCG